MHAQPFRPVVAAIGLLCLGMLTGCDMVGDVFAKSKTPIPGDRVAVLSEGSDLVPDRGAGGPDSVRLPRPAVNDSWPQSGGFANFAMHHLEIGDDPRVAWRVDVGSGSGSDRQILAPPVIADGLVFVKDALNVVSAFDAEGGRLAWRVTLGSKGGRDDDESGGGLAFYGGRIFVTTGYAAVISLDARTGAEIWRRQVSAPVRGAPTVFKDRVFAIGIDNKLHALAAADGAPLWDFSALSENAGFLAGSSPSVSGDTVVAAFSSGELIGLRIENGRMSWNESLIAQRRGGAQTLAALADIRGRPVIDRGRAFAIGSAGQIAAFDLRNGSRIWDRSVGGYQTPWVAGRFVYIVSSNAEVACLGRDDGKVRWVQPLTAFRDERRRTEITWSGPVLAGDRLLVAGSTGEIIALSPYDGEPMGKINVGEPILLAPVIANRTLYVLTDNGNLVALR